MSGRRSLLSLAQAADLRLRVAAHRVKGGLNDKEAIMAWRAEHGPSMSYETLRAAVYRGYPDCPVAPLKGRGYDAKRLRQRILSCQDVANIRQALARHREAGNLNDSELLRAWRAHWRPDVSLETVKKAAYGGYSGCSEPPLVGRGRDADRERGYAPKPTMRGLTDDQVRQLRRERAEGWTVAELGEKYLLGKSTVQRILARITYRDIE